MISVSERYKVVIYVLRCALFARLGQLATDSSLKRGYARIES